MGLGVLDASYEDVPGTVDVYESEQRTAELAERATHLKKDKSGRFILVPQPSDDPNDPLNWSLKRRDFILCILCFVSVLATTASPLLAADTITIAINFKITFQNAALLTAFHLCGVAVGGVLSVASARVWGKRHLFLLGSLLMIASSAWGGSTHKGYSFKSMLWARVFQGVALAPFESLVNACVGDLYFVHERGKRMALTNVSLFGGAFLTPVFVGMISHNPHLGWEWSFYFVAIFMAPGFLLLVFFVPETAFRRAAYLNTDMEDLTSSKSSPESSSTTPANPHEKITSTNTTTSHTVGTKTPWAKTLLPFNGRKTDDSFFKLLIRPFPLFAHPAILWACLIQGVIIGWTVMVAVIIALIFLGPPLFFSELRTGYQYTAAFIGSMIGLILSGLLSDSTTKMMIRWNKGKYEPEFRILLVIPMLITTAIGLYGFAMTASNTLKYGWLIPDVFLAFIIISMVMGAVSSALYIVDAHREIAIEAFTCLMIFKNIFSFILAYNAYNWVFKASIRTLFIVFGSIEVGICLLSIPMYVLGKRNRAFFARHDLLKMMGLR